MKKYNFTYRCYGKPCLLKGKIYMAKILNLLYKENRKLSDVFHCNRLKLKLNNIIL